jgi:hypothetical protein
MNLKLRHGRIITNATLYGLLLALTSIGAVVLAVELAAPAGEQAQLIAGNVAMGAIAVAAIGWAFKTVVSATSDHPASPSSRPDLDNPHTHVMRRTDDGYGLGVWDRDEGVTLMEFDDEGNAYEEVWVLPGEVDDVQAALEEYGREASSTGGDDGE